MFCGEHSSVNAVGIRQDSDPSPVSEAAGVIAACATQGRRVQQPGTVVVDTEWSTTNPVEQGQGAPKSHPNPAIHSLNVAIFIEQVNIYVWIS